MDVHLAPTPPNEGHGMHGMSLLWLWAVLILRDRPRSARGKKEVGVIGQASWLSSIINLVNTSMDIKYGKRIPH